MISVTIIKRNQIVYLRRAPSNPVEVIKKISIVKYEANAPIQCRPTFKDFYFIAQAGQDQFSLESFPIKILNLAINGVLQSQLKGDFTVAGMIITLSDGVDAGDEVFGTYEEQ